MSSQIYALLVGIDFYANPAQAPHLRGCVADVKGNYQLLTNQLGVSAANIRLLTSTPHASGENRPQEGPDQLPTRANIIRGWREHLAQAGQGDHVFFNYSGHGAQATSFDPNESDGFDETLVCQDSRSPGVYDLLDKELAKLIEEVEQRGAQVTVFLDCCHSGSGTRAAAAARGEQDDDLPRVRKCKTDTRPRPLDTLLEGVTVRPPLGDGTTRAATRKAPSGWISLGNHILLAGCRDAELSHEYRSPETGQWQGATTYFFQKYMANYRAGTTWRDIHDFVQTHVHAVYPAQSPQLEGTEDLEVFGGLAEPVTGYLLVSPSEEAEIVELNAGAAVGLTPGSTIAIFRPSSDLVGEPIATAMIESVEVDRAYARLDRQIAVEPASRARITARGYNEQPHRVAVDDPDVLAAIQANAQSEFGSFLEVVSPSDEKESSTALFRVVVQDGHYVVQDAAGEQIVDEMPAVGPEGAKTVAENLEHLATYRNVLLLDNASPDPQLKENIKFSAVTFTKFSRANREPIDAQPIRNEGGEAAVTTDQNVSLELQYTSFQNLYVAVFHLSHSFGVKRLYPRRNPFELLAPTPGNTLHIPLQLSLDNPRLSKAKDVFKVIVTKQPTSFDALELRPLNQGGPQVGTRITPKTALGRLINARRGMTREATLLFEEEGGDSEWFTTQLGITVIAADREQQLRSGETQADIGSALDITLNKPADFDGSIAVGSLERSTRTATVQPRAEEFVMATPPGLDTLEASQYFRPLTLGVGTRAGGETPAMATIEATGAQLDAVSPEKPLHMELTVEDEPGLAGIMPVAYDGEFFYLAGEPAAVDVATAGTRATPPAGKRRLAVDINLLVDVQTDEDEVRRRDLKRTARLLFYKIFRKDLPEDTGVRKAERDANGKAVYSPATKADVTGSQKVALMIHGLTADTIWLVEQVWPIVQPIVGYDLCLTYDYETVGTQMKENGRILDATLREKLGFGQDDNIQLDIYAHSMGTQVSRALVELWQGADYVDRVFMGGPPNAGSPLAKAKEAVPWLGSLLINQIGAVPVSMLAGWALNKVTDAESGLSDLAPDSPFYTEINVQGKAKNPVPYFIQIGDNTNPYRDWNKLFQRIMKRADAALDMIFGGDHDLAVGVTSAEVVTQGDWANVTLAKLPVNHFRYFYSQEGRTILEGWLQPNVIDGA